MSIGLIPVVDFFAYNIKRQEPDQERFQQLIDEVHAAFSTIGFVYLINTGLSKEKIANGFSKSASFFKSSIKHKSESSKTSHNVPGFVTIEEEGLNPDRPHKDLKEIFDLIPSKKNTIQKSCDTITPGFIDSLCDIFEELKRLNFRVLEVVGRGLKLEDPLYFTKAHHLMGQLGNHTTLRTLYYPPVSNYVQKEGQIRCGEHSDYGGVTLLLQDDVGGLEVKPLTGNGEFIAATPMKDSVVVNIGDMLQRWTADKLVSTIHRVVVPKGALSNTSRQSIALFGHPDSGHEIVCIDGSNKYPPANVDDYMVSKYNKSFLEKIE